MGAHIAMPSDKAPFVDPKTGQLTVAARHTMEEIIRAIAASVTGPDISVIDDKATWATTDGKQLKDGGP